MNNTESAIQFFLQIATILLACRIVGVIAAKLGQPQVVAEMLTGVLLGPSLFGLMAPEWQEWLFPWDSSQTLRDTSSYLYPASQIGLALYMFIVGLEFRVDIVRKQMKCSAAVSVAGVIVPFILGAGLAWIIFHHTELFPEKTSLLEAMLFLGASMCITAFPVLARLIHFKGLTGTKMGTVALGAGAIDDAMAWILLAVVLASLDGEIGRSLFNIGGALAYVALTLGLIRPLIGRFSRYLIEGENRLSDAGFALALSLMALGGWFTDLIGLHSVFGAFIMGAAMPRGVFVRDLIARIKPLTVALFLPLFFAYSGLNTKIGLLNSAYLWGIAAAVLAVAVLGKWAACTVAARATGIAGREAMGIGILMNARGLMELIIINIGLQRGIISEGLFAVLVIMAVVTTLMASPVFELIMGKAVRASEPELEVELIPVSSQ